MRYRIYDKQGVLFAKGDSGNRAEALLRFPEVAAQVLYPAVVGKATSCAAESNLLSCVVLKDSAAGSSDLEMWRLQPEVRRQWQGNVQGNALMSSLQGLLLPAGRQVAVHSGGESVLHDWDTGAVLARVAHSELASTAIVIPERGWLVYAASASNRLGVVSLEAPHPLLQMVGKGESSRFGTWRTELLETAAAGRLLLREQHFSSRLLSAVSKVEVYDLATWQVVWTRQVHGTASAAIAPDGRRIAIAHGEELEILRVELMH